MENEQEKRLPGNNITINLSPLRIVGCKKKLIQKHDLMDYFPECKTYKRFNAVKNCAITHRRVYVELFCGSAIMFFNLDPTPFYAILNDIDHDIFNFWNVVLMKYDDFIKELQFVWCGQDWIEKYRTRTDDVGRAIFFYIQNRISEYINVPGKFPKEIQFNDWKAKMDKSRLQIWNHGYKDAMERINKMKYDENDHCMEFLVFQDPPYFGTEKFYKNKFTVQDHQILAKLNHESTHHIILTYNDCPEVRELYKDWHIKELENYTTFKWQYQNELLLSNKPFVKRSNKSQDVKLF